MVIRPSLIVLDIDGVVTNGSASLSPSGEEIKAFCFHDLDAVTQLMQRGIQVAFVTGEEGPLVDAIARRFGVTTVIRGAKDKLAAIRALASERKLQLDTIMYIGDGDRDAPALAAVGLGLAPVNATPAAKAAAHRILTHPGGAGAIAEATRLIPALNRADNSHLIPEIQRILNDSLEAHQRLLNSSLSILAKIAATITEALSTGHKLLFFGNGGSAADAQHISAEFVGRYLRERRPLAALALTTDASAITAVGNDWDFEEVFARQVRALALPGDVVIGMSTSGTSPNVLRGLAVGRECGSVTIGFTGQNGGEMPFTSDLCFCAPADSTPRIQELHILAWHTICEIVETKLLDDGNNSDWL